MLKFIAALFVFFSSTFLCYAQLQHAVVKKYNTHIYFDGNKLIQHTDIEIQINTTNGTNYAEVDIYSKNQLKDLNANIEDLNGNIIKKLKKKDLKHTSASSYSTFHSDGQYTSFSLIYNQYPHIFKYSYTTELTNYIHLINWLPCNKFNCPIEEATLSATLPNNYLYRTIEKGIDTTFSKIDPINELTTYIWKVNYPSKPESEKYAPSGYTWTPRVEIIPTAFNYGIKGTTDSWSTFGNWLYKLNLNMNELTQEEKATVHQLTDTITNKHDKIKVLYHYLQDNTRYINVSLDLGGLQTYPAEYVCINKYGDCKALSNYMQALLNEAGIPSYYTVIYAGLKPFKVLEEYPSQQFNHVILVVPQDRDTIWLECTSSIAPFNYLGTHTQGRKALIVNSNSKLIDTPALSADDCHNIYSTLVKIKSGQNSLISTKSIQRGYNFEYFRSFGKNIPKDKQSALLNRINFMSRLTFKEINNEIIHRDSSYLLLNFKAETPYLTEEIGDRTIIHPLNQFSFKLEKPQKRTQPVAIYKPIAQTDTIIYHFNKKIKDIKGCRNLQFDSSFGIYKKTVEQNDSTLKVIRTIIINRGTYPVTDYNSFYDFIQDINQTENQKILISYK
nr:transglutaminase domain-containing protein [uncultured Carboxylicivirga sp.]